MNQRIIDRSNVGEVLQQIYASDMALSITLFSQDGYFYVGHHEKRLALQGTTIEEAVTFLACRIAREYPTSSFARWWHNSFPSDSAS